MAVAAVVTSAGCSLGADEEAPQASGAPAEIAAAVERLERASADGDWEAVCAEVFTAAARERAGGADCERRLRRSAAGLRAPSIEIRGIRLRRGGRARVEVSTGADRQDAVLEVLELRREDGSWRVDSLAG